MRLLLIMIYSLCSLSVAADVHLGVEKVFDAPELTKCKFVGEIERQCDRCLLCSQGRSVHSCLVSLQSCSGCPVGLAGGHLDLLFPPQVRACRQARRTASPRRTRWLFGPQSKQPPSPSGRRGPSGEPCGQRSQGPDWPSPLDYAETHITRSVKANKGGSRGTELTRGGVTTMPCAFVAVLTDKHK